MANESNGNNRINWWELSMEGLGMEVAGPSADASVDVQEQPVGQQKGGQGQRRRQEPQLIRNRTQIGADFVINNVGLEKMTVGGIMNHVMRFCFWAVNQLNGLKALDKKQSEGVKETVGPCYPDMHKVGESVLIKRKGMENIDEMWIIGQIMMILYWAGTQLNALNELEGRRKKEREEVMKKKDEKVAELEGKLTEMAEAMKTNYQVMEEAMKMKDQVIALLAEKLNNQIFMNKNASDIITMKDKMIAQLTKDKESTTPVSLPEPSPTEAMASPLPLALNPAMMDFPPFVQMPPNFRFQFPGQPSPGQVSSVQMAAGAPGQLPPGPRPAQLLADHQGLLSPAQAPVPMPAGPMFPGQPHGHQPPRQMIPPQSLAPPGSFPGQPRPGQNPQHLGQIPAAFPPHFYGPPGPHHPMLAAASPGQHPHTQHPQQQRLQQQQQRPQQQRQQHPHPHPQQQQRPGSDPQSRQPRDYQVQQMQMQRQMQWMNGQGAMMRPMDGAQPPPQHRVPDAMQQNGEQGPIRRESHGAAPKRKPYPNPRQNRRE